MTKISSVSDHLNRAAIEDISFQGTTRSHSTQAFEQSASVIPAEGVIARLMKDLGDENLLVALKSNLAPTITDRDLLRPHVFQSVVQSLTGLEDLAQNYPKLLEELKKIIANYEAVQAGSQALVSA